MIFLSIQLSKYTRAKTPDIKIEFTGGVHLFVGSNGSGKTSIMSEISVLPSDKADFDIGGCKVVELIERGSKYVLSSFLDEKPMYSFIKVVNGVNVEMNNVGSISVQRDLAMSEFGLSQKMQSVLMRSSESRGFSLMTPQERKNWISIISDIDYEYAISVHSTLMDKIKKTKAVIEYLSTVSLSLDHISGQELEFLKTKQTLLSGDVVLYKEILRKIEKEAGKESLDRKKFATSVRQTRALLGRYWNSRSVVEKSPTKFYSSDRTPSDNLKAHTEEMVEVVTNIGILEAEKRGLSVSVEDGKKRLSFDMEEAVRKRDSLSSIIESKTSTKEVVLFKEEFIYRAAALRESMLVIFKSIPSSDKYSYSVDAYWECKSNIDSLGIRLADIEGLINKTEKRIDNMPIAMPTCPACDFSWEDTNDRLRIVDTKSELEKMNIAKTELLSEINDASLHYIFLSGSKECSDAYNRMIDEFSMAELSVREISMWDFIKENKIMSSEDLINGFIDDIEKYSSIHFKLSSLSKELSSIKSEITENSFFTKDSFYKSIAQIDKITDKIAKENEYKDELNVSIDRISTMSLAGEQLIENAEYIDNNRHLVTTDLIRADLMSLWHLVSEHLGVAERELASLSMEIDMNSKTVREFESNARTIEKEKNNLRDLMIIERNLSPKTGLIGEAISDFISTLVRNINSTVASVWGDPFIILPPSTDSDGGFSIDYKFPIVLGGVKQVEKADIKMGSKAMREMIDMGFSVIASKLSGVGAFPIYLDEFSHSLDDRHVQNSIDCISDLAKTSDSQIFLASHNHLLYAGLPYTEITALCLENINNDGLSDIVNRTTTFG